jgi:DNA helicase MCM9
MTQNRRDNDDDEETIAVLQSFLEEHHLKDIRHMLLQDDTSEHYSVEVNTLELFDSNIHVSQRLLAEPIKTMPLFDSALAQAAMTIMQDTDTPTNMCFKPNLHIRLSNLPVCPELKRNTIPKSSDNGKFLAISGIKHVVQ